MGYTDLFSFNGSNVDFGSYINAADWFKKQLAAKMQPWDQKIKLEWLQKIDSSFEESNKNFEQLGLRLNGLKLKSEEPNKNKTSFMDTKLGKFGGQYGGAIGNAASAIGGIIGKRGMDGKYGGITKGMDTAYDTIQQAALNFGPIGNIVSGAMGVGKLLGNAVSKIGGGTDGMTKTDAIMNSAFLTPLGLINGFGGKRANTYTRNAELDTQTNGGFLGFLTTQDVTQIGAGKKYGLFSSGARNKQNKLTEFTLNMKHTVSGIVDTNTVNNLAALGSTPFLAQQLAIDLSGGVQQMRAARSGMKIKKYQNPANPFTSKKNPFKLKNYTRPKGIKSLTPKPWGPEGMQLLYDKDGNPTRGLTRALELGYEPVVGYDGKPRFIGYKSNPALPYMLKAQKAYSYKNGALIAKKIVSKYQIGRKLKRSIQTIDVATGKYVDLPTDLTKEQVNGSMPIKLANGTVVFMLKNGTVTSDRWETVGEREHLTPKGLEGVKVEDLRLAKLKGEEPIDYMNDGTPLYMKGDGTIGPISEPGKDNLFLLVEDSNANFAKRLRDPNRKAIKLPDGTWGNFKLAWSEDETGVIVYPEIQEIDGKLVDLSSDRDAAWKSAIERGDYIYFPSKEAAEWFTTHYKEYYKGFNEEPESFKQGGQMNVIPEGALHARLNHLDLINDDLKEVTTKGIPVITKEGGEVIQHAEIEHSEIIFTLEVTNKIEDLRKKWHEDKEDKYAIEAGKLLVKEILHNTDDRTNLIESVE